MPNLSGLPSVTPDALIEGRPAARCDDCGQARVALRGHKLVCAVCRPPAGPDVPIYEGQIERGRLIWRRAAEEPSHALYVEIDRLDCFRVAADAPFGETFEVVGEPWQGVAPGRYVRLTRERFEKLGQRHKWDKDKLLPVAVEAFNCGVLGDEWFDQVRWKQRR